MNLLEVAAHVMVLAQDRGELDAAEQLAVRTLADHPDAAPADLAALWYALAIVHHCGRDEPSVLVAAGHCLRVAEEAGLTGWVANARAVGALVMARSGQMEAALIELARAEVELSATADEGLRNWAHAGLGYCYLDLRLYELAQPHFEAATRCEADPIPLPSSRTIDLMNLAELHLRWADELERVIADDAGWAAAGARDDSVVETTVDAATVRRHREIGHAHAIDAVTRARAGDTELLQRSLALELCSRPLHEAASWVAQLERAFADPQHVPHTGSRAQLGGWLARGLWQLGRRTEALAVAQTARELAERAADWQVVAGAGWLLVELQAQSGIAGAAAGRAYGRTLSRVLWQQRLSTLQGARAALDVERLHRDKELALREAAEDPLTGVGNRRALTNALDAAAARFGDQTPDVGHHPPLSLLVIDLDDFKAINDLHGHVVGDEVLRAVATALRSVARAEDVVVRLGGDEFVVLAQEVDRAAGQALADRARRAIEAAQVTSPAGAVALRASVGVATTSDLVGPDDLLDEADRAMYREKPGERGLPSQRGA